jgi:hypothetical protein
MKRLTVILLLGVVSSVLLTADLLGQSAKTIKEKKIASQTVYEYFLEQGMDKPVVESVETYNEEGMLTEIKEFNSKGELKLWEAYSYDEDGNLVEARFFNSRGKLERKEVTVYSDGLRVERLFYNQKDKLVKRKVYEYEYRE